MKNLWEKVKEFFSRPKVIKWTIVILTLTIVFGAIKVLVWTIYTKDKPAFVPQEVREDIQGAIKESGEAIRTVSRPVGTAIVNSAYKKPAPVVNDPTAGWKTYTNPDLRISFKYPDSWTIDSPYSNIRVYETKYIDYEGEFPVVLIRKYNDQGLNLNEWLNINYPYFIGEQKPSEVVGFNDRTTGKTIKGYDVLNLTYESMGSNRLTLIHINNEVFVVESNVQDEEANIYENIVETIL